MRMEIISLTRYIGAEIRGVDLAQPLDEATRKNLYTAWLDHLVLVFRGQQLDQQQFLAATGNFGKLAELARPPEMRPSGMAKLLEGIMLISNIRENGQPIGLLPDGEMWFHHDMLHVDFPHKGTCLYSLEVPSRGGNTLFANCYRAYETLPPALRDSLEDKRAFNSYNLGEQKRGDGKGAAKLLKMASHPVFRTHDETGRKAVNVNRLMTDHVEGLTREESDRLLKAVWDHSENREWIYEHEWRKNDLIVWDNRCSMHARTDFPENERRLMLRTTLEGGLRPV
jgi:taurine dioxygenase